MLHKGKFINHVAKSVEGFAKFASPHVLWMTPKCLNDILKQPLSGSVIISFSPFKVSPSIRYPSILNDSELGFVIRTLCKVRAASFS